MIPNAFAFERVNTVEAALDRLGADGEAKLLAGGHSLLPLMKMRLSSPSKLIDISGIDALRGVRREEGRIIIGALTPHREVAVHPLVQAHLPALAQAAAQIGDLQVRNRGTLGGNLAHADPSSDLPAVALAYDAELTVVTAEGSELLPVDGFFLAPLTTAMPEGGILTQVSFVIPPEGAHSVYEKYSHPASGYAVVGVAAVVALTSGRVSHIRVGITGAGDAAYRATAVEEALLDQVWSRERVQAASRHADENGGIGEDLFASEAYRRHLCQVYTRRALERLG